MHILALDIGNTRTSTGHFIHDCLTTREDIETNTLPKALHNIANTPLDIAIISCVSQRMAFVTDEIRQILSCPVIFIDPASAPIKIHYDNPKSVGQDRIVNALGAKYHVKGGAIVIDTGTATHFDIIDPQGEFWGGPILAGIETMHQALTNRIIHLPQFQLHPQIDPISQNTISAMNTGTILCAAGGIERIVYEFRKQLTYPVQTILTGGNAHLIKPHIAYDIWAPNLTLQGLCQYAKYFLQNSTKISA